MRALLAKRPRLVVSKGIAEAVVYLQVCLHVRVCDCARVHVVAYEMWIDGAAVVHVCAVAGVPASIRCVKAG